MPDGRSDLDRFFELSLEMLCIASLEDGYFKRLNPSWQRTLGFSMDELLARPFIDFVHPDDREGSSAQVAGLVQGITIVSFENRFLCKDGSYVWLAWTATPHAEAGLLYAAGRDITERKRAEAQIRALNHSLAERAEDLQDQNAALAAHADQLKAHEAGLERLVDLNRALLDASVDAIRLVDREGRTLLANAVSEQLNVEVFGLPGEATLQERSAIAHRLTDPAAYLATMQAIADDAEYSGQDCFEFSDDRRAFQRYTAPVRHAGGALIGRISVVREITAEREAERLKSELMATVSHELRTPLTGVLGFTELLLSHATDKPTRVRYLRTIHGEAKRLTALIDDFLDLQKIEAGRFALALAPFDLAELVEHEVEIFSAQSSSHRLVFASPDEQLVISGDRNRIGQVLANLLSNAIKYSPAGGRVTIAARAAAGVTRVSVTDCGLGIPAAQQAQVFTKFFRVDSSDTRSIGGTGLGLALCQEMVAAHGGRIGFESSEGHGSTFWFELPLTAQALPAPDTAEAAPAAPGRAIGSMRSVLVVDDDAMLRRLVVETLMRDGRETREATAGAQALPMIAAQRPDAVVLDLAMPGLDGFTVLYELRRETETRQLPVVVLTAAELSEAERRALNEGSTWLLEKRDYSSDELCRLLGEALGEARALPSARVA